MEGMQYVILLICCLLLYFIFTLDDLKRLGKDMSLAFIIYNTIECALSYAQLAGIIQNSESAYPIGGTLGNPNALSLSLIIGIWFILPMLKGDNKQKWVGLILLLLNLSIIIILQCRTAWVALTLGAIYYINVSSI